MGDLEAWVEFDPKRHHIEPRVGMQIDAYAKDLLDRLSHSGEPVVGVFSGTEFLVTPQEHYTIADIVGEWRKKSDAETRLSSATPKEVRIRQEIKKRSAEGQELDDVYADMRQEGWEL